MLLDIFRNLGYGFSKRSFKSCILRKTKTFLLHTSSQGITSLAFFVFVLCVIQTTYRYYKNSAYLMVN